MHWVVNKKDTVSVEQAAAFFGILVKQNRKKRRIDLNIVGIHIKVSIIISYRNEIDTFVTVSLLFSSPRLSKCSHSKNHKVVH